MSQPSKTYLFIDESGDPAFYASGNKIIVGSEGFKPLLLIGMVEIKNKKAVRNAIIEFMDELRNDELYKNLPCILNSKGWYLHASYDNIEVQVKFIDFLRKLEGFKFYCVMGRKRIDIFHNKHNRNETEFYFDLVSHLLQGRLQMEDTFYQIFLSARNKTTQHKLKHTIEDALRKDNSKRLEPLKIHYNSEIVVSKETPELSIVDYMLWALQRYIIRKEARFFKALEHKYDLIIDLYDFDKINKGGDSNYYHLENKFSVEKASEFRSDGYT